MKEDKKSTKAVCPICCKPGEITEGLHPEGWIWAHGLAYCSKMCLNGSESIILLRIKSTLETLIKTGKANCGKNYNCVEDVHELARDLLGMIERCLGER